MKTNLKRAFFLTGIAALSVFSNAFAFDASEAKILSETKVSLIQAIQTAEKNLGGTAVEASLDDDSFKPAYEVSVVKDGKVFDVQVDGVNGEVLGSREDRED